MCNVLYPVDIRRATGDKARLNPPNQLCFTVLATLPLYIAYRSPYICLFHVRACRRHLHTRTLDISLRAHSCRCVHFRLGYLHECVKRKHQKGDQYRHDAACPCFMVSQLIPFREFDLYESPCQEFYPRRGVPREDYYRRERVLCMLHAADLFTHGRW